MHLSDGVLFFFGMSMISMQTVIPVFIEQAGGTAVAIAAVQALSIIGMNLPQLLVINSGFNPPKLLPLILRYSGLYRLMFLVIGIYAFIIPLFSPDTAVFILAVLIISPAILGSLAGPLWFHLMFLTTPVNLRGRLMGVRQFIGALLGVIGGYVVKLILDGLPFPVNFGTIFLIAFVFLLGSYLFLMNVKEPDRIIEAGQTTVIRLKERIGSVLKQDKNFRNYLIADFLSLMSFTSTSFFAVYGIAKFGLKPGTAGAYTMVMMATMSAANIVFGIIADRYGHKVNIQILTIAAFLSVVTALTAPSAFLFGIVFVFTALILAIQGISRMSFLAELCEEKERIAYIGILNSVTAPALLFGLLSGLLINYWGYEIVFVIDGICSAAALLIITRFVVNPRKIRAD